MKKILYIGNNLAAKTSYNSTMATLSKLLINEGYVVTRFSDKKNKITRLIAMCTAIVTKGKKNDFILIDTFSTVSFYYALITSQIARLFSIKYIPILHGGNLPSRLDKSYFFSKLIFNNSYKNVTPSIYLQQAFRKKGFDTHFIPNGIPIEEYNYKQRTIIKPKLLWVRAFDKTYNPLLAIKVLVELKKKYPQATLCMVGPDKDGTLGEAKKLAKKLEIYMSIKFTGVLPKEEWHRLSENYDIFINTTNVDNMPVSIIEAMALGLPIVSTNAGGLPYLISNSIDGILVDIDNEQEMADAIINILEHPLKVSNLSQNARLKAEKYDLKIIKNQWLDLLT
ncbi:glycosyltransferase family 4 protein [Lutibacter sp.]|uniref:glycosyltransferase family 4 protein n=1 Tax=Lutibacter sp. TaxID=1925666 RepID=UPI0025C65B54|nr:glycosyltransferase family 4 protein [Lutibacter sp.]MCF6168398.1 glycosyltransferase family 4 protein [Lutibacter sp.]